jgi:putative hydrolase of the HAD superfamily
VTFSGEVGWRKPHERIFNAALQALGATATETVMVGDSEHDDIGGAHTAGMRAVLYAVDAAGDVTTSADAVIGRLYDIVDLLDVAAVPILDARL